MIQYAIRVHPEADRLPREQQFAWKIAEVASAPATIDDDVADMVVNRLIDAAAVAIAAINRPPVVSARTQALRHERRDGATVLGCPQKTRVHAEWAAWANGVAVRELDFDDTFLAADFSHPADSTPAIVAVAQQRACDGPAIIRGIATAYEIQLALTRAISLHKYKIDHVAHLAPAIAAGIGATLNLDTSTIYQAVQQALHVNIATRQSRKGQISSWKAYAPAHTGKLTVEAVDRAMHGETAPSPIYEGEDSIIAAVLGGKEARYVVELPAAAEPRRAILASYPKEHSAEYQAQALIDLAFKLRQRINDWDAIAEIVIETSHHTHYVIGSGANDPQKMDPDASRETLDHSIMYIVAVALQDGVWHHVESYLPQRAHRPDTLALWHKIHTVEDPRWTARYHADDPEKKAFGGRMVIRLRDGRVIADELAVANAHNLGAKPWERADYVRKFETLTNGIIKDGEARRFLELAKHLPTAQAGRLQGLTVSLPAGRLATSSAQGIF